jgi:hypothetical protein
MFKLFMRAPDTTTRRCANCAHFRNDPAFIEQAVPGLATMSSAHASVRCDDGICLRHDRYLSARSSCVDHALLTVEDATNCRMVAVV